jgi:hypothetical protein
VIATGTRFSGRLGGGIVTIHGSGFSPMPGDNEVRIDGHTCLVKRAALHRILIKAPLNKAPSHEGTK